MRGQPQAENPYILYGASNLGSMLALLAYPAAIEPLLALTNQTLVWAGSTVVLCVLMIASGAYLWRVGGQDAPAGHVSAGAGPAIAWPTRMMWVLLAAAPSSLMLGATTYISNDVASVPLFWVIPLALYLFTFVVAFQTKPIISRDRALLWQAVCVSGAAVLFCIDTTSLLAHLMVYLGAFFFCALVCHQKLAASRPPPARLTEFYLLISFGGVVGGMFNALLAPILFDTVMEFPLVLVLCCLARPWPAGRLPGRTLFLAGAGIAAAACIALIPAGPQTMALTLILALCAGVAAAAVGTRALPFTLVIGALSAQAIVVPPDRRENLYTARSFFGVHRVTLASEPAVGGTLHLLFHGTTIYGASGRHRNFAARP